MFATIHYCPQWCASWIDRFISPLDESSHTQPQGTTSDNSHEEITEEISIVLRNRLVVVQYSKLAQTVHPGIHLLIANPLFLDVGNT